MNEKQVLVVYGGSFNPPLNSHFSIAEQVLNQYEEVEKVIFIPVNKKYEKDGLLDNVHRYNMLKSVIEKNDRFLLSDMDLDESRSMYTIETLKEINKQYPNKEVWFLIGSDNLHDLYRWNSAEELVSKYKVLVMERNKDDVEDIIYHNELYSKYRDNILKLSDDIKNNFSSTYVRGLLENGKSIRYLVPDEVYHYICNHQLYQKK